MLPDDQLLLGGEGGEVNLGPGEGGGGQKEETSNRLQHLEKCKLLGDRQEKVGHPHKSDRRRLISSFRVIYSNLKVKYFFYDF